MCFFSSIAANLGGKPSNSLTYNTWILPALIIGLELFSFFLEFIENMRKTTVQLIILACLLIVRANGHEVCRPRKIQTTVLTQGCGAKTVSSFGCNGYCMSTAEPRLGRRGFAETCTCCKPIKTKIKRVVLCNSPRDVRVVAVAKKCTCRTCWLDLKI